MVQLQVRVSMTPKEDGTGHDIRFEYDILRREDTTDDEVGFGNEFQKMFIEVFKHVEGEDMQLKGMRII